MNATDISNLTVSLGGAATFASVGGASAPGQYTAREARTVLDIIEGAPQ